MAFPIPVVDAVVRAGEKLIDRLIPDLQAADKAKQEWMVMVHQGEVASRLAQIEVNKEEAKSDSLFVSGWRPATGWICVFGLAYTFVVSPIFTWLSLNFGIIAPPALGLDVLLSLLGGMLGLTGVRSFEKVKGVSRETLKSSAKPGDSKEPLDPYVG